MKNVILLKMVVVASPPFKYILMGYFLGRGDIFVREG